MEQYDISEYSEMVAALVKDGDAIIADLTSDSAHLLHMAVGLAGEIAELQEYELLGKCRDNLVEELGDCEFYNDALCEIIGLSNRKGRANIAATDLRTALSYASMFAGQVLDLAKKAAIYGQPADITALQIALQSTQNALAVVYTLTHVNREAALQANMAKLYTRYSEGKFTNKAATDRNDKVDANEESVPTSDDDTDEDVDISTEDSTESEEAVHTESE